MKKLIVAAAVAATVSGCASPEPDGLNPLQQLAWQCGDGNYYSCESFNDAVVTAGVLCSAGNVVACRMLRGEQ